MEKKLADWLYLPDGVEEISLWDSLHDGRLCSLNSNRMEQTLLLEFDVAHLRKRVGAPVEMRFIFKGEGVQAVRAEAYSHWPGPAPTYEKGMPQAEAQRRFEEYQEKGRYDSVSWESVEALLSKEDTSVNLSDASLAAFVHAPEGEMSKAKSLQINGNIVGSDQYYVLTVRAGDFTVTRSDGEPLTLEQFMDLGHDYWRDFAERSKAKQK